MPIDWMSILIAMIGSGGLSQFIIIINDRMREKVADRKAPSFSDQLEHIESFKPKAPIIASSFEALAKRDAINGIIFRTIRDFTPYYVIMAVFGFAVIFLGIIGVTDKNSRGTGVALITFGLIVAALCIIIINRENRARELYGAVLSCDICQADDILNEDLQDQKEKKVRVSALAANYQNTANDLHEFLEHRVNRTTIGWEATSTLREAAKNADNTAKKLESIALGKRG